MDNKPPYKDTVGRWRTQSLFIELPHEDYPPVFTLKEFDYLDKNTNTLYPSMRRLFLESRDPTGYRFSRSSLLSYAHWKKLISVQWFAEDHLLGWLEELDVKLKSDGLQKIVELASGESGSAFQAAKYLAERDIKQSVGRPKKIKKASPLESLDVEDDFKRINP